MPLLTFNPGPSKLYPTIPQHIQEALDQGIPSFSHRSEAFQDIVSVTVGNLKKGLQVPEDYSIFFLGSATEAMERLIQNGVAKYSYHFVNGAFSSRFFEIAQELGKSPEKADVELGAAHDLSKASIPAHAELICLTHCETSTGVWQPLDALPTLRQRHPEALIALDAVSSLPYAELDFAQLDAMFFSVQKGFGLPAGLGVLMVSPRYLEKARRLEEQGYSLGSFHSFPSLQKWAARRQTPETPNVLGIYLLGKVAGDFLNTGLATLRAETEKKVAALETLVKDHPAIDFFVENRHWRSPTAVVLKMEKAAQIRDALRKEGIVVGSGYGSFKDQHLRIANFPAHTHDDVLRLLAPLKMATPIRL